MKPQLISITACDSKIISQVKNKLDQFYNSVPDYSAFEVSSNQQHCWHYLEEHIRKLLSNEQHVKILEVGAGKSGFGEFLSTINLREFCHWTAQDVTRQNAEWLQSQADHVIFGDIESANINEDFDVVFSTYVLEHVTNPLAHLNKLASLIRRQQGTLFIFCPRYDMPGFMPPSTRHLGLRDKIKFLLIGLSYRLRTILSNQPAFLIQTDLAAFHCPFFRDADAVHWASLYDLKAWARSQNGKLHPLKIGNPPFLSKDWIVKRLLTIGVSIQFVL